MQFSKKLLTATITALLLVSAIATIIPVFAFPVGATAALSASTGPVGTTITVAGVDTDAPGAPLNVYWENTGGVLLATGFADGAGNYNISLTIPDAAAGTHFIIVQDIIPSTVSVAFVVTSKITLSPASGIPGDLVNVTGTGFSGNSSSSQRNVTINFSNATGTVFSQNVAAVNATGTGNFTVLFTVPAVDYGAYTVTATDQATGGAHSATAAFTVSAAITISPTSGPSGTVVTITGRGFSHIAGLAISITVGVVTAPKVAPIVTAADGTISGQFIVPTLAVLPGQGRYTVSAADPNFTATTSGTGSFRVTATTTVTVTPTSGQPGSAVALTGTGFAQIAGTSVAIRFGQTAPGALQLATFTTNSTGGFSGPITIPNLPTGSGYFINGTDSYNLTAVTTFSIAITALYLSPTSAPTGTVVTMTAFGLGLTGGTTFNLTINGALITPSTTTVIPTPATVATFTVPTLPVGTYNVAATDNLGIQASTTFVVTATSTLTVNPSTAPVGVTGVSLTLTNFGAGVTVDYWISNATNTYALTVAPASPFVTLVTNASGTALATFTVPPLALGSYFIKANETSGQWNATTAFNIGAATLNVNTRATTYVQGDTVSWNIQSTFMTGFDIFIYDPANTPSRLSILDGATYWMPVGALWVYPIAAGNGVSWSQGSTFALPNDAIVGTWTWNASITLGTTLTIKSGTFNVTAPTAVTLNTTSVNTALAQINTTVNTVNTKLDLINATLIAINGNVATLSTNVGYVLTNVTAIGANVTSIKGTVATIQTNLGTLTTTVNNINGNITAVTTVGSTLTTMNGKLDSISAAVSGIATISTTVGTIQTSLSDIGAKVSSIQTAVGGIATIQTDLGTLTGTVTSIQGNVATIQTAIGTLQVDVTKTDTDVNNVPGQVNIPIWIAVVLALIAALAAIASLLLVRRKIAG
jgi:hypothetical protein